MADRGYATSDGARFKVQQGKADGQPFFHVVDTNFVEAWRADGTPLMYYVISMEYTPEAARLKCRRLNGDEHE